MRWVAEVACALPDESSLMREINQQWTLQHHLLALIIDVLREGNWMQTEDGQKGRRRPKPIPRPGVEDPDSKKFGSAKMSMAEAKAWLDRRRGRATSNQ